MIDFSSIDFSNIDSDTMTWIIYIIIFIFIVGIIITIILVVNNTKKMKTNCILYVKNKKGKYYYLVLDKKTYNYNYFYYKNIKKIINIKTNNFNVSIKNDNGSPILYDNSSCLDKPLNINLTPNTLHVFPCDGIEINKNFKLNITIT